MYNAFMDKHSYCRIMLKDARHEAKTQGVKLPFVNSAKMHDQEYAVFIGDDWYEEYGACCAFYARSEAIWEYIDPK